MSVADKRLSDFPKIAAQLNPALNNGVTADQIAAGSNKKFVWRCNQGPDHVWRTTANGRTNGKGCPCCTGLQVSITNSLATLFPDVAAQLDPELNNGVTADQVVAGSNKKFTWWCPGGPDHVWKTTVNNRTSNSTGCPYCAGKRVSITNSLATLFPDVAAQLDPELNAGVTADQIVAGSHTKFTWRCPGGPDHVWEATADKRTSGKGQGCPYCASKRVSVTNSLAALHPKIAAQLDPSLNNGVTADQVVAGSNKKFTWRCDEGPDHVWITTASSRTFSGACCPCCAGRQLSVTNSLATLHPKVAAQLDSELNGGITADQILAGTEMKYTWRCPKGPDHVWKATADQRTRAGSGCLCCAGQKISVTNSLATLHPKFAAQLDPELNNGATADQILAGSHTKITWRCPEGPDHVWSTTANGRTNGKGSGCPRCFFRRSQPEIRIMCELASVFSEVEIDIDPSNEFKVGRWRFDGVATQLQLLIEYDGSYYHHNDSERGARKAAHARLAGWTLIRLRGVSKQYVAPVEHFLDMAVDETESEYVSTLRLLERLVEISDPSFRLAEGAAIKAHRAELQRALELYVEEGGPIASERADALIEERMRKTNVPVEQPLFTLADQASGPLVRPSEVAA